MRQVLAAGLPLALAHLVIGWYLGYRSVAAYLLFWSSTAFVLLAASTVARRMFRSTDPIDWLMRVTLIAFALIVTGGLLLGVVGLLRPWAFLVFAAAALVICAWRTPRRTNDRPAPEIAVPIWIVAIAAALVVFAASVGTTSWPPTAYDSLSYHLFFPARWLQEHRLSIVPTPFSDEAQAYAPANGELLFLWMMLPFHGDLVARIGQLPFYLLGGAALFALARRAGARSEHAVYAPAFLFVSRPMLEQAVGADVDLICLATLLTSLYFGIGAVDSNERRDWIFWGISLGLFWGTKYVALVYTPILLLLALVRGPRLRTLWALPGIAAFALPWYVRNWVAAGSPIYPATLKIAGVTVGLGAYDRSAMLQSVFHTTDVRLLPIVVSHAFGTPLFLVWVPFAAIGAVSMLARQPWWPGAFLLATPLLMVPLFWFGVPDNIDARFLLPAVAAAMLPLAFVFGSNRRWNAAAHGVFVAALLWVIVGMNAEIPARVPWFMGGWLTLQGLVNRPFLLLFAGIGAAAAAAWRFSPRWVVALAAAAFASVSIGADRWCLPARCEFLQITPNYVRSTMTEAWGWVKDHTHDATFAYSGNNVPYPIVGDRLTNRVYYVNIDRHAQWRFHDYARARGKHADAVASELARSSGVLLAAGAAGSVRPRYERMIGYRDAWIDNLKQAGVDYLFISALSAYEINYLWHDERGFPIEQQWAQADPQAFQLVYENPDVRIYHVSLH